MENGVAAIGSGGNFALSAAIALMETDMDAEKIARKAMAIAGDMCIYTNHNIRLLEVDKRYDVVVVGAGAAGMMAAATAGKRGRSVLVIEGTDKIGEKIRISGGGRCNFTNINASHLNYISENKHFVKSALARYTQHDFIDMVRKYGISYHEKTLGSIVL